MSEEKTRIVPRTPPQVAGEWITFACDNGHRIVVAAKNAGKRGTCSKCGIPVVIPAPGVEAGGDEHPTESHEPAARAGAEAPGISAASAIAEPPVQEHEFAGLFEAVSADQTRGSGVEAVGEEPAQAESSAGHGTSGIGIVVANEPVESYANDYDSAAGADNPTAQLVARLWAEREHGGKFEIHVTGGGVILPQWYEPRWSRGTHGLFANQAADGTVTLTAVAWESVQKIVVRQVEGLPDGMFE